MMVFIVKTNPLLSRVDQYTIITSQSRADLLGLVRLVMKVCGGCEGVAGVQGDESGRVSRQLYGETVRYLQVPERDLRHAPVHISTNRIHCVQPDFIQ